MADAQSGVRRGGAGRGRRGRIVRRYFLIFATLVGGALVASVVLEMGFRFAETRRNLETVHRQMAELAAVRIRNTIEDVAQALRLAAQPHRMEDGQLPDEYLAELRNLLSNVPSIRDAFAVGLDGRERFRSSRIGPTVPDAGANHSLGALFHRRPRRARPTLGRSTFRRTRSSRAWS